VDVLEREAPVPVAVDPWTRIEMVRQLCQPIVDEAAAAESGESLDEVRYLLAARVLRLLDGAT
jgi:hypothetical protein